MTPHSHVDAPLSVYILIEGRSFRKKIRLIIVKLLKKIVANRLNLATIFTFTKKSRDLFLHHVLFTIFGEFCRQILILLREILNRFLRAIAFVL